MKKSILSPGSRRRGLLKAAGVGGREDLREIAAGMARLTVHGGRMDAKQMDQIGKN